MTEKIKVTKTTVYDYVPNYDEDFYLQANISTIDGAMKADAESVKKGEISVDEIAEEVSTMYKWEIINE